MVVIEHLNIVTVLNLCSVRIFLSALSDETKLLYAVPG